MRASISSHAWPAPRRQRVRAWVVVLTLALAVLVSACAATAPRVAGPADRAADGFAPTVILVSFDGWRADYSTRVHLPHLSRLAAAGVRAEYLIPAFPSKTFPNHYTLVTGLYPGHHGIVANNIWDAASGRTFALSKRHEVQDPMWWGGEPIWVTAMRAGQRAATMFWPGSEAPIAGRHPTYWRPYDETVAGSDRVAQVLRWLDLPASERPTFLALYFEDTDDAGHEGPDLPAVADAVRRIDGWIGELMAGLDARRLADRVNIVLVSDHGMASTSIDRVVMLDDYISLDDVRIVDINPTIGLVPAPGREDAVIQALRRAPHLQVYRRTETPEHWRYRAHPRIPPLVGVADEGWQVMTRAQYQALRASGRGATSGQHGYDPRVASMRSLFVAAGPAVRRGAAVKPFENVSVYSMLARMLGLEPAANDGDPSVVEQVLRPAQPERSADIRSLACGAILR